MSVMQVKRLILIVGSLLMASLTWWSARSWLSGSNLASWTNFLAPLLFVIGYAAVVGIALTLLPSKWDRLAIITSSWAAFILFFPASIWYLSVLPVFFLFLMESSRRSQRELKERHTFRPRIVFGAATKFILLGIFLMVSLGFYSLRTNGGITLEAVSEGVQRSVDNAYETSFIQTRLEGLSETVQAQLRRDVAGYIDAFIKDWLGPIAPALPPILALGLFLVLWSLVGIIGEPVLWVSSGLFIIMKRTGFVTVVQEQVPKDVVNL